METRRKIWYKTIVELSHEEIEYFNSRNWENSLPQYEQLNENLIKMGIIYTNFNKSGFELTKFGKQLIQCVEIKYNKTRQEVIDDIVNKL